MNKKLDKNYINIINIINRNKFIIGFVCLICIFSSMVIGRFNYNHRYINYFTIYLGNDLIINDWNEEYNEVNNILFNIETIIKSEQIMDNVVSKISNKSKIDNSYDLRESIEYLYDINNKNITIRIISKYEDDSRIISETLRKVLNKELTNHIKEASLEFGNINLEEPIKVGNSSKNYIIIGILLAIYINIILIFYYLRKE